VISRLFTSSGSQSDGFDLGSGDAVVPEMTIGQTDAPG
jgi:hypothetical protein